MVNALYPGGAEVQLVHLARGLARRGHEVTICCMNVAVIAEAELRESGVEVVSLHAESRVQRLLALPRLIRLARRSEIVHCTIWDASLWGRIAAILARRPVIVAEHATDRGIHTSLSGASRADWVALHNRLLDPFTYATVVCAVAQREVLESEGVAAGKIVYIPNGLPVADTVEAAGKSPGRAAFGLPEDVALIMQVGLFREEKNQVGALEAVAGLREEGRKVELAFVGGHGPTLPQVQARAEEMGADWAHFLGYRADVAAVLGLADILIQPSDADSMPMVLLEAMALGVPIVATDVGDIAAMLESRAGIVVPPRDPAALRAACAELLEDPGKRAELGAAGREIAAGRDATEMAKRYELLIEDALEGRPPDDLPAAEQRDPLPS